MTTVEYDIVIIGGGIIGLSTAYKLALKYPQLRLAVLEKEESVAKHQTGHNSGVIHSGLYYKPGSVKAVTCKKGREQLVQFAQANNIKHEICGKIIVATDEKELPHLELVYKNGITNGIKGIERIDAAGIKKIEPMFTGIAGLYVPCTGVIDYVKVAEKLAELIEESGDNKVLTGHKVIAFQGQGIMTSRRLIKSQYVINCAGLQCDRIAKMAGLRSDIKIVPFRGDYLQLTKQAENKVKKLIYPVPDPAFPFLGVHFTRTIDGDVECGPNAVFSMAREGYSKIAFDLRDSFEALIYLGTWKLFLRHMMFGLGEYSRTFSKRLMLRQLKRLMPSLGSSELKPAKCGIRAQALDGKGNMVDDFRVEAKDNMIHVLNAPSPAATAGLAIGDEIVERAKTYFQLGA